MLFRGRFDKQIEHLKEKRGDVKRAYDDENIQNAMEKNDLLAMIISALIVIMPVAILFLLDAVGAGPVLF